MYPPHHLGGYELTWHSWVRHARELGHEVRVLASEFGVGGPGAAFPGDDGVVRALRSYWRDNAFPNLPLRARLAVERRNQAELTDELERLRPDAVAWWAMGGLSMSMIEAVRRRGLPAIGIVCDDWLVYGPQVDGWQRAFRHPALARVAERATGIPTTIDLDRAARWIFLSETTRRRARDGGRETASSTVLHPGIDPARFPSAPERPWDWRLLYVGRIDPRKGIATAVRALAELPAEARLRIDGGGDEPHLGELRRLVEDLGLRGRVEFGREPREQLGRLYASADVTLFPVLWEEPWGLVPLESMAAGRPVIATGTGGSGEYLDDGENCLLFAPRDDPRALAGAIRRLAGDPELRRRLRAGGLKTAERFTERGYNNALNAELESAVASRR
jgi:glycosyltransferase involved in cell wall biosynthesis